VSFRPQHDPSHLYFVTLTLHGWKRLLSEPAYASIVLGSLDWLRRRGRWSLYAFVIMPSHLHTVVRPSGSLLITDVLRQFASYTAHAILKQLREEQQNGLLSFFAGHADPGKRHGIWQEVQAKNVYSAAFLRQKLEYIHSNPVVKRWALADSRADYPYSSACFYDRGTMPLIGLDDVRPWLS
jgi:putative transposase